MLLSSYRLAPESLPRGKAGECVHSLGQQQKWQRVSPCSSLGELGNTSPQALTMQHKEEKVVVSFSHRYKDTFPELAASPPHLLSKANRAAS